MAISNASTAIDWAMASPMPKTSLRNVFCRARFSAIMNPFLINDEELGNQGKDTSRGAICTPYFHRCDNEKRLFRQLIEVCQILQDHTARTEPDLVYREGVRIYRV